MMITTPTAMNCQKGSVTKNKTVLNEAAIISEAITVPTIVGPPNRPPITTAAAIEANWFSGCGAPPSCVP
jgi:hypothetical protein